MSDARPRLRELAEVALRSLPEMYDERSGLFSHKAELRDGRIVNREPNRYYSAAALVGVLSQRIAPADATVSVGRVLDALAEATQVDHNWTLLGTALWAGALAGDRRFAQLVSVLDEELVVERVESASLGQVLQGLVVGAEAFPDQEERAARVAARCADELQARFSPAAELFRGVPFRPSGARTLLGARVTSFAAQVYPLLGLSSFARWRNQPPPPLLRVVAERIVRAQGPQGQWWWLYSSATGAVLERYPVYSVHQDGMAFMGLVPVEQLGEGSYREPLARGVEWLYEENELSMSLVLDDPPFICRNIQRRGSDADAQFGISRANLARVISRSLRGVAGSEGDGTPAATELEPLYECRSYHLGWLLYAYSLVAE
jgi:hypothetical protein